MIYGIDEVGRGCLAGPVCAGCVAFTDDFEPSLRARCAVADSKALPPETREASARIIKTCCAWGLGWVYPSEIDAINIHHASLAAMRLAFEAALRMSRALHKNAAEPHLILIDGSFVPPGLPAEYAQKARSVIKGDATIAQIQAASIVAKAARDGLMKMLHEAFPQYGFADHKGYPTPAHKRALAEHGALYCHRKSFASVREWL